MRDESLGQRAQREAIVSRPVFSVALHARLRQAVLGTPRPMPLEIKSSPNRLRAWVTASAAALLLVAVVLGWQRPDLPRTSEPGEPGAGVAAPAPAFATAPSIATTAPNEATPADEVEDLVAVADATAAEFDRLMVAAVEEHQWANYDFDVQLALKEYAQQLPIDLSPALAWSGLVAEGE